MARVFISHRRSDLGQAYMLAEDLRSLGHLVWLDDDEVKIGDSIISKMNDGLEKSSYLILCLSAAGVDSPWIAREWMSALARQLDGADITLLPVRLPGAEVPAIIADIKYADLSKDWTEAIKILNKRLN